MVKILISVVGSGIFCMHEQKKKIDDRLRVKTHETLGVMSLEHLQLRPLILSVKV